MFLIDDPLCHWCNQQLCNTRETLSTISSPPRMSPLIDSHDLTGSRRAFSFSKVNSLSTTNTRAQARWLSTVHLMVVRYPLLFSFWWLPHDDATGLLVCGSIVRAPEGTFGAAVAEGGVTDLLKVVMLPLNILKILSFSFLVSQIHQR